MVRPHEKANERSQSGTCICCIRYVPLSCLWFLSCLFANGEGHRPALWQYQSLHNDQLPDAVESATELEAIANGLISNADVNKQVLTHIPRDLMEYELSWPQLECHLTN